MLPIFSASDITNYTPLPITSTTLLHNPVIYETQGDQDSDGGTYGARVPSDPIHLDQIQCIPKHRGTIWILSRESRGPPTLSHMIISVPLCIMMPIIAASERQKNTDVDPYVVSQPHTPPPPHLFTPHLRCYPLIKSREYQKESVVGQQTMSPTLRSRKTVSWPSQQVGTTRTA